GRSSLSGVSFFFQAEDGIRDFHVTGVQTCALPISFGGTNAPDGFLLCQGQAISRTTYAELFAVIGTAFGDGDGSTTFNIPDFTRSEERRVGKEWRSRWRWHRGSEMMYLVLVPRSRV